MQSNELKTIYNNAAEIISLRLRDYPKVGEVLDDLRGRVFTKQVDPRNNPDLIIEPAMLSQVINVPRKTVEAVVEELQRFNLIHIWVRAICPTVEEDDDNVIVETNDPTEFKNALREACVHCGGHHDALGWSGVETFFALHVGDTADDFSLRRFFIPHAKLARPDPGSLRKPGDKPPKQRLWLRWLHFFGRRARKPAKTETEVESAVVASLARNRSNSVPPTHERLAWWLAAFLCGWSLVVVIAFLVCRRYCDVWTTVTVTLILTLTEVLVSSIALRVIYAASFAIRSLVWLSFFITLTLFGSSYDFEIKWGENVPPMITFGSATPDWKLASLALIAFIVTALLIVFDPVRTGWFKA